MLNNKAGYQYFKGRCNYSRRTAHKESQCRTRHKKSQCRTRQADKPAASTTSNKPNGMTVAPWEGSRNIKYQDNQTNQTNPPPNKPFGNRNSRQKPLNQLGNPSANNVTSNNVTTDEPVIKYYICHQ